MRASIDSATPKPLQCLFCAHQKDARRIRVRLSRVATRVRGACIHTRCASLQTKIPCWDAGCCCCSFSGVVGCQRCGSIDGNTAPSERKAVCCSETSVALGWASEGQRRKRLRAVYYSTFQSRCWTAQLRIRSHFGATEASCNPVVRPRPPDGRRLFVRRQAPFAKAATWLILPVVICLSQRLSHACLSINCFIL